MTSMFKSLWNKIVDLNFFESDQIDETSLRDQRFFTRFYIITLLLSVSILLIISSVRIETRTIEVVNPSFSTYTNLLTFNQSNKLKCPCTDISSKYDDFVQMTPYYHQVCSSDLISSDWINVLFDMIKISTLNSLVFEKTAYHDFQILRNLCELSQSLVNDSLLTLYSTLVISEQLLDEQLLNAQIDAAKNDFQLNLLQSLYRPLSFVRTFTLTNGLISATNTAFTLFLIYYNEMYLWSVYDQWYQQSNQSICSCATSTTCHLSAEEEDREQTNAQEYTQALDAQFVADWYVGCWPIESVLLSSLTTFYNQSALNKITHTTNFSALYPSKLIYFNATATIADLINNLFIEKWIINIS